MKGSSEAEKFFAGLFAAGVTDKSQLPNGTGPRLCGFCLNGMVFENEPIRVL